MKEEYLIVRSGITARISVPANKTLFFFFVSMIENTQITQEYTVTKSIPAAPFHKQKTAFAKKIRNFFASDLFLVSHTVNVKHGSNRKRKMGEVNDINLFSSFH